ncbi:MAG TPA: hypothetical protein VFB15_03940 [Candidatus Binataceae bacterium]|nr:hypothetical protein [Candidatus Binataceae bacterium]
MISEQREGLRRIRSRRLRLWSGISLGFTLLIAASWMHRVWLALFALGCTVGVGIYLAIRASRARCPRCAQYFHSPSADPSLRRLLTTRCLHCGLPLSADRVVYPSME